MSYLPIRKLIKCVRSKNRIKQEKTSCLTECLLKESREQSERELRRDQYFFFFIFLVLFIILYSMSMHHYVSAPVFPNAVRPEQDTTNNQINDLPLCYVNTSTLGEVKLTKFVMKEMLDYVHPSVRKGGYYAPKDCRSRSKVGILVPYRERELHLSIFLYNMHPFLIKQKLEYRIFVIEQAGYDPFNRGRLFNAGFKEMMKFGDWKCVIFHDVDLLPLDESILYTCPIWPRKMCGSIADETNPKFRTLFGGVSAMDVKHFTKVNGYSNDYWGWGGEDNDIFRRLQSSGVPVVQYDAKEARYSSLPHLKQQKNRNRYSLLKNSIVRYKNDGLKTQKYKVLSSKLYHLYTHIIVDINPERKLIKQ